MLSPNTEKKINEFIASVSACGHINMHNPWLDRCATELHPDGPESRKARLKQHLSTPNPKLLIIGEAPGYQGCRYTGLAFTSERLLMEGAIPRMEGLDRERITSRNRPWSEPSATIVWGALHEHGLAEETVLFNAVPWHPEGAKGPHSNRTPSTSEKREGFKFLGMLLEIYPGIQVAALGNTASDLLTEQGVDHVKLRHPANGGATLFRNGLAKIVANRKA